jgi:hypothetical protein
MTPFSQFARLTIARDASLIAFAAGILMTAFSFELSLAFDIGATVALLFSIMLVIRVFRLTDDRLLRSEQWRALPDECRPDDGDDRHRARAELGTVMLQFAKNAAGVAGVLYGSALVISIT